MGNAGRTSRISHPAPPARTALACTATCARTEPPAYCPNRGCRKFTKQSLDEHAARYHKQEVGSHNVRQQLSEEQLRIRTRLLCILLTVLFLARQHIALRKLPFVAKLVHSFGSTTFTLGRQYVGKDAANVYTRRWKIAHLFDDGWDEGNVYKKVSKGKGVDRRTLYDVNYPSDSKTVPQQLSFTGTNQYGAGGWEAEPREVWVMIRPIPSGSRSASTSRKR